VCVCTVNVRAGVHDGFIVNIVGLSSERASARTGGCQSAASERHLICWQYLYIIVLLFCVLVVG
jgi:hypothetical protein